MQQVCNLSVIPEEYLCGVIHQTKRIIMDEEKAKKIQRYYDYFRLAAVILIVGLLVYISQNQ